jgi:1,2-dihydroxy-3-keto-5-methylthiopentene dioxygenase
MAILSIPDQHKRLEASADIQEFLNARGILFEQWEASTPLALNASQEEILDAYRATLEPYMAKHGYQTADVISVNEQTPNLTELRQKFIREHTHTEDEVRFFVEGQGHFWFHLKEKDEVFCVTCQAGDLLSVPAGFEHWFDMGPDPFVKVIRIFIDPAGWVAHYTDSGVDARYQPAEV